MVEGDAVVVDADTLVVDPDTLVGEPDSVVASAFRLMVDPYADRATGDGVVACPDGMELTLTPWWRRMTAWWRTLPALSMVRLSQS